LGRHRRVVDLEEGDARGVGAPPVRPRPAAAEDLLFVHPIELAVEHLGGAVRRERTLVTRDVRHIQVVVQEEREQPPVRAELELLFRAGSGSQARDGVAAERPVVDVVAERQGEAGVVAREGATRVARSRRFGRRDARQFHKRRLQLRRLVERRLGTRLGVDLHHVAAASGLRAARAPAKADELLVVDPRVAAAESRRAEIDPLDGVVEVVDCQEFLLRARGHGRERHECRNRGQAAHRRG
jgi:hypothetical protein